jgi:hypothetical protein
MYCMSLRVYTCEEAASGPKTFLNIFWKLLHQKEPSPAWQWSWFQYQLTLIYNGRSIRVTLATCKGNISGDIEPLYFT